MSKRAAVASKRKRSDEDSEDAKPVVSTNKKPSGTAFGNWLDEGQPGEDDNTEHEGVTMILEGRAIEISLGDAVLMRSGDEKTLQDEYSDQEDDTMGYDDKSPPKADAKMMIARVERIWETKAKPGENTGAYMFQARWFLRPADLEALQGEFVGSSHDLTFFDQLTRHDLVLSNQTDDNALTTIATEALVLYRHPEADDQLPAISTNTYICRYSIAFGSGEDHHVHVTGFAGQNDDWDNFITPSRGNDKKPRRGGPAEQNQSPGSSRQNTGVQKRSRTVDSGSDSSSEDPRGGGGIDEGNGEQRNIRVGPEHQVPVPRFVPGRQKIVSRQPKPVWKQNQIPQKECSRYVSRASRVLVPYLHDNLLTHVEPYSPLVWDQMEAFTKEMRDTSMPTLSSIATASSLSEQRTDMLREVDIDSLLRNLHEKYYNVEEALRVVKAFPQRFVTSWTPLQKKSLDSSFRRYAGSLRMVFKGLTSSKSFKDVVDYVYRFKIPDQFRRFQEIKQEQAVRMIEAIESRRNIDVAVNANRDTNSIDGGPNRKSKEDGWQKTGVGEVTGAVEDRRVVAKKLLLQVESELGKAKLAEIVHVIKNFHKKPVIESRIMITRILGGDHEQLQQRFLEFLPRRF